MTEKLILIWLYFMICFCSVVFVITTTLLISSLISESIQDMERREARKERIKWLEIKLGLRDPNT